MSCVKPLSAERTPSGDIIFSKLGRYESISIPCGRCIGCRIKRTKDWSIRIMHETSFHEKNSFITLTYNDENIPRDGSLSKKECKKFINKLRKYLEAKYCPINVDLSPQFIKRGKNKGQIKILGKTVEPIKFYWVGEYGEKNNRPHYHAIIFGYDFNNWIYLRESNSGYPMYTSEELEKLWNKGFVTVQEVTQETAEYCAGYIQKKLNGKAAEKYDEEKQLNQ